MRVFEVRASSSSPRLPLCQFSFFRSPNRRACPWRKITYSLNHSVHLMPQEPKLLLWNKSDHKCIWLHIEMINWNNSKLHTAVAMPTICTPTNVQRLSQKCKFCRQNYISLVYRSPLPMTQHHHSLVLSLCRRVLCKMERTQQIKHECSVLERIPVGVVFA